MSTDTQAAPKQWRVRFFEDLEIGDVYRSRLGRTITETDNIWFTCLTLNTNQIHFNTPYAERTQFGKPLVNSTFTLALITGMTVPDTSENAAANLQWTDIKLPKPVFAGDTLWAESEILELRESKSNPSVGIVTMRCRGVNQRREVVIEFKRTFMVYKRDAPEGDVDVRPSRWRREHEQRREDADGHCASAASAEAASRPAPSASWSRTRAFGPARSPANTAPASARSRPPPLPYTGSTRPSTQREQTATTTPAATAVRTPATTWSLALPRPVASSTIARAPDSTEVCRKRASLPAWRRIRSTAARAAGGASGGRRSGWRPKTTRSPSTCPIGP